MNNIVWHCDKCGEPVDENDMFGYFVDNRHQYVPGSLGFWHNKEKCSYRGPNNTPMDLHIRDLIPNTPFYVGRWLIRGIDPLDVAIMNMRCCAPGYEQVSHLCKKAAEDGVIETIQPIELLYDSEILRIAQHYGITLP